ncbi:MAG: dihydroorotase family protein [Hydrogenophaga sp.]|uniref:dihydroorotase n=1 Tax=Hydrogenophaga sp. TaxID=1904254 RepID=UPI0025C63CE4|nr:dihydroorotase family protein [Hydrogenophaga sp.]MBU7576260.1 dihydroorotase family protein [Hydrogenophaga sp.]
MDTLIRHGLIVTPQGRRVASIGIQGGRIAGIYEPGSEPAAREVIDADGLAIVPGAIDMHSHHRQGSLPGFEYKDTIHTSTLQCAAGGVTTSVAMPNVQPPPNSLELLERQYDIYRSDAIVDWNFNPAPTISEEMPGMADTGIAAFKIFMVVDTGRDYPHMPGIGVHDHGKILEIMQRCAELNVPLMVHPHDQALMDVIEQKFWDRGERDALAYAKAYAAHDGVIWETAIATLLRLQRASGCHLHILHTQTAGSVELIRQAKAAGQKVTCEINPWALFLGCEWSAIQRLGSYALSYWVPEKNVPGLWEGLRDGTIDIVATDHAPHTREEKEIGWTDGWKAHTGTPSTQFYYSMFMTAALEGKISLERVVEACSAKPAELFKLANKGALKVGADADLVLVDLNKEYEVRDEDVLSLIGWSPYAGRKLKAKPVRTIVRGTTVYLNDQVIGQKGFGQHAKAVREPVAAVA